VQPLLLDTCALIWMAEDEPLAPEANAALSAAHVQAALTYVSPISAWEVGLLAARERLQLLITPQRWFARILDLPNVLLADMSPDLLIASSFLPGKPPRDPADRIILATARDLGATLITRDRVLIDYASQGHVKILPC
jgi:PIN domain nuclease of toxin-antitoxin system